MGVLTRPDGQDAHPTRNTPYLIPVPYSAIVDAFKELTRQLLTETEAQLAEWKRKCLNALGMNGQVLINVIPELECIIGKQPDVLELGLAESKNRFNLLFRNFVRLFCTPEHPLVIFLEIYSGPILPACVGCR